MAGERIEQKIDGRLRPVHDAPPLLLSSASAWSGFLLERDLCRHGGAQTIAYPQTSLVLADAGSIQVEDRALNRSPRFVAHEGSVTLWPAGHESRDIRWGALPGAGGDTVMIRVQLDVSVLQRLAHDDEHELRRPLAPQPGVDDATLASMVRVMAREIAAGCSAGRLFADSLCLAVAAHVARRYGGQRQPRIAGGLTARQLRAVREHIELQLGGDLSLAALAAAAQLSPSHFCAAFRHSLGVTPHRYVLGRRIDEAKTLLRQRGTPVAEVALALGFASQSHFTDVFRRHVGTTPGRFQQDS